MGNLEDNFNYSTEYKSTGYQPSKNLEKTIPPFGGSGVIKPCEHKFIYLGQRRVKDEYSMTLNMTKLVDVFYCEKCLVYRNKDC